MEELTDYCLYLNLTTGWPILELNYCLDLNLLLSRLEELTTAYLPLPIPTVLRLHFQLPTH